MTNTVTMAISHRLSSTTSNNSSKLISSPSPDDMAMDMLFCTAGWLD